MAKQFSGLRSVTQLWVGPSPLPLLPSPPPSHPLPSAAGLRLGVELGSAEGWIRLEFGLRPEWCSGPGCGVTRMWSGSRRGWGRGMVVFKGRAKPG